MNILDEYIGELQAREIASKTVSYVTSKSEDPEVKALSLALKEILRKELLNSPEQKICVDSD